MSKEGKLMQNNQEGKLRTIYLPKDFDVQVEQVRARLKWSRSYLYKYALTRLLEQLSVLTEAAHNNREDPKNGS
jgi:hypothetical protein